MTSPITVIEGNDLAPLEAQAGDRLQMLVFSASWCAPCKAMAPAVEEIAAGYAGQVAVARIDIEACPDLAKRFEVRGVPTLVLRRGGDQVDRHVGGLTRTRLAVMLDGALAEEAGA